MVGRLVDFDGRPLAVATVRLVSDASPFLLDHIPARTSDEHQLVPPPQLLAATTDSDGRFEFTGVNPLHSFYLVTELADSGTDVHAVSFTLPAGIATDIGDIRLRRTKLVEGMLRDHQGRAVAGADVTADTGIFGEMEIRPGDFARDLGLVYRTSEGGYLVWTAPPWLAQIDREHGLWRSEGATYRTTSDADGRFRIPEVSEELTNLTVRIVGAAVRLRSDFLDANAEGPFLLPELRDRELLILDSEQKPLEGAEVRVGIAEVRLSRGEIEAIAESEHSSVMALDAPRVTNASGRIAVRVLASGPALVCVRPRGAASWIVREWTLSSTEPVTVQVPPLHDALVHVLDARAQPIGSRVSVLPRIGPSLGPCADQALYLQLFVPAVLTPTTTISPPHALRLAALDIGTYDAIAFADGKSTRSVPLRIDGSATAEVNVTLPDARPLRVRISGESEVSDVPLAGALVTWTLDGVDDESGEWGRAITNDDGEVLIADRGPTRCVLTVQHPEYAWAEKTLSATDGSDVTIRLVRGGEIHGCVVGLGGRARQRVLAHVAPLSGSVSANASNTQSILVDDEHCFRSVHLPDGEYDVEIYTADDEPTTVAGLEPRRLAAARVKVHLHETVDTTLHVVATPLNEDNRGARAFGVVRCNGKPWARALILLSDSWPNTSDVLERLRTNDSGEYETGLAPPGAYTLSVQIEAPVGGFDTLVRKNLVLAASEELEIDFDLALNGPLDGRVHLPAGVSFSSTSVWAESDRLVFRVNCGDGGSFSFATLPAGDYRITADSFECVPSSVDVRVMPQGKLAPILFEIRPGPPVRGHVAVPEGLGGGEREIHFVLVAHDASERAPQTLPHDFDRSVTVDGETKKFDTRSLLPGSYRVYLLPTRADGPGRAESLAVTIPPMGVDDLVLTFERTQDKR